MPESLENSLYVVLAELLVDLAAMSDGIEIGFDDGLVEEMVLGNDDDLQTILVYR